VTVARLPESTWKRLCEAATERLDSLTDLLAGKFPEDLKDTFFAQRTGLFPTPGEIRFTCSCPDWASMCKHVAAVLYGIGNRLDRSPELLFTLRQVSLDELLARTVDATAAGLVGRADSAASDGDVLSDADLSDVFGIELDTSPGAGGAEGDAQVQARAGEDGSDPGPESPFRRTGPAEVGRPVGQVAGGGRARSSGRKHARRGAKAVGEPEAGRMVEQLMLALGRRRRPFSTADLAAELPAWTRQQVTNTLQRAIDQGRLQRVARGLYRRV
jgi:hypothetical protein